MLSAEHNTRPFLENPDRGLGNALAEQSQPPGGIYRVIIIDNDWNTYDQVMRICIEALEVDVEHAYKIALAVDNNGRAEVARLPKLEADRVAGVIRTIGIEVQVLPVENDTSG
ncbi:MAG: ATP-dependent Clp protease adaptor ClpS [Spirochaetia bacterium]|nr:ATP-dependent Clp protease adaptor ClpS [Spirochaetia bacterium]